LTFNAPQIIIFINIKYFFKEKFMHNRDKEQHEVKKKPKKTLKEKRREKKEKKEKSKFS